jgi:hypothetical protein
MQIVNNNLAKAEHIPFTTPKNIGETDTRQENPVTLDPELKSEKLEELNSAELNLAKPEAKSEIRDFLENTLVKITTSISAIANLISSPVRLLNDESPLKKIINQTSMLLTRVHLGAYSVAGLISAFEQKNPFLIFSFLTEGITSFLSLRKIYLFRGIATGIDGAVAGIKDKHKKSSFKSYSESWNHSIKAVKDSFNSIHKRIKENPLNIFKLDGSDIAIFSSLTAAFGGILGSTIHEKSGSIIRDVAGGVGDYGVFKLDNPIAKSSGFFYLGGTLLDLAARIFNKGIAGVLGIQEVAHFERLREDRKSVV